MDSVDIGISNFKRIDKREHNTHISKMRNILQLLVKCLLAVVNIS